MVVVERTGPIFGSIRHWPYVEVAKIGTNHDDLAADLSCSLRLVRQKTVLVWRNVEFPVPSGVVEALERVVVSDSRLCKGKPEAQHTAQRFLKDTMIQAARANRRSSIWWKRQPRSRPDLLVLPYGGKLDPVVYEVKVNRSDFLDDVRHRKFRAYHFLSNRLFFAGPVGLIRKDEVPEGCGLIERHPDGWRIRVQAPRTNTFQPTDRFSASLVSRMRDPLPWDPTVREHAIRLIEKQVGAPDQTRHGVGLSLGRRMGARPPAINRRRGLKRLASPDSQTTQGTSMTTTTRTTRGDQPCPQNQSACSQTQQRQTKPRYPAQHPQKMAL